MHCYHQPNIPLDAIKCLDEAALMEHHLRRHPQLTANQAARAWYERWGARFRAAVAHIKNERVT